MHSTVIKFKLVSSNLKESLIIQIFLKVIILFAWYVKLSQKFETFNGNIDYGFITANTMGEVIIIFENHATNWDHFCVTYLGKFCILQ